VIKQFSDKISKSHVTVKFQKYFMTVVNLSSRLHGAKVDQIVICNRTQKHTVQNYVLSLKSSNRKSFQ